MHIRTSIMLLLLTTSISAQHGSGATLLLNGGFEHHLTRPIDWFYSGTDFTNVMKYWESPTGASPDIYGHGIHVPKHWQEKGFGSGRPHHGQSMVGITVYGCQGGKPHCREYIQTQLVEPLVPGQRYELIYWVRHLSKTIHINHVSAAFTEERTRIPTDERLEPSFVLTGDQILSSASGFWLQCKYEFQAQNEANYLIIGNFAPDEKTRIAKNCSGKDCLPFAYYYIDDVSLRKLPPILTAPVWNHEAAYHPLEAGKTIHLQYVFFDSGKSQFLPRSLRELNTLLDILRKYPTMEIEVRGHTDNLGTPEFNEDLSIHRARNVVNYLLEHDIEAARLQYKGFGALQPIAPNETEEGRAKNRRVEFVILRMSEGVNE